MPFPTFSSLRVDVPDGNKKKKNEILLAILSKHIKTLTENIKLAGEFILIVRIRMSSHTNAPSSKFNYLFSFELSKTVVVVDLEIRFVNEKLCQLKSD